MSSSNISSYTSQENAKKQSQTSIYGINVKGFGLAVDQAEQAERFGNLLAVRDLEELERSRRITEAREFDMDIERFRISARKEANLAQEEERKRRLADTQAEAARKQLANQLSTSIAKDILSPSLRLKDAAAEAFKDAKIFSVDLVATAGNYAHRAANFFGYTKDQTIEKASEFAQNIKGQAVEQAHQLSERASDTAHSISVKASEQVQSIKDQAFEQANTLTEKATGKARELVRSASQKAQELTDMAVGQAQSFGDKVVNFGTDMLNYTGAFEFLTRNNLSVLEDAERQWRMSSGLTIDRFLNALKVSDMIKNTAIYAPDFEPNRWYATSILEEFERKRRSTVNKTDRTATSNAKSLSRIIHLKNIQEQSYHPDAKQMEKVEDIVAKKSNAFKTSSLIKTAGLAQTAPLGMAAM